MRTVSLDATAADNIETVILDDFLHGERVTFIKMDIEGAELDALRGASRIIKEQKPKLAISIYHRLEDIIEIPKLIISLRPDYRLYVNHISLPVCTSAGADRHVCHSPHPHSLQVSQEINYM